MVGKHKFDKSTTPTAQADSPEPETENPLNGLRRRSGTAPREASASR